MKNQLSILVVGSINMDLVITVPRFPKPGETLTGNSFITSPGGKGANQAVASSRLGAKVAMIGCVGKDEFGKQIVGNLQKEKVSLRRIKFTPLLPTGTAVITVNKNAQNQIIVIPGANSLVSPEYVISVWNTRSVAPRAVLLQLEIPLKTVKIGRNFFRIFQGRVNARRENKLPGLCNSFLAFRRTDIFHKKFSGVRICRLGTQADIGRIGQIFVQRGISDRPLLLNNVLEIGYPERSLPTYNSGRDGGERVHHMGLLPGEGFDKIQPLFPLELFQIPKKLCRAAVLRRIVDRYFPLPFGVEKVIEAPGNLPGPY